MAKVKAIQQYRTEQHGNTTVEIPVADEESQVIMEMNFRQYVNVLSDILVKYASNFKAGQAVGVHLCLQYIDASAVLSCFLLYINSRKVESI